MLHPSDKHHHDYAKGIVQQLGKCTCLLSCRGLDEKIDTTLMSVR